MLYKNFVAFKLKNSLKKCIENYPNADKVNCILTYGYIDYDAGLTMEILPLELKTVITLHSLIHHYFDDIDDALIEGLFFSLLLNDEEIKREVLGIFTEEIYNSLKKAEK